MIEKKEKQAKKKTKKKKAQTQDETQNQSIEFNFDIEPIPSGLHEKQEQLKTKLSEYLPLQLFECFFDPEVYSLIITQTNLYAKQKNTNFELDWLHLRRFIGILVLTSYHTLPGIRDYWSNQPSLGIPIVRQTMTRNEFMEIKRHIHFCDNNKLDSADKLAKVNNMSLIL